MAIAKVKSVTNSCFINGSPATIGQEINYGDVIETYNIDIGLQESFKSGELADSGMLKLYWIKTEQPSGIRSFCKVIFKSSGKWAGPDTVLLDPKSEIIAPPRPFTEADGRHHHPNKLVEIAKVAKARGQVQIKHASDELHGWISVKTGGSIFVGDIIKVGGVGFCTIVFLDDKSILQITASSQFQFTGSSNTRTIDVDFGKVLADVKKDKRKGFRIETPTSVAGVKG